MTWRKIKIELEAKLQAVQPTGIFSSGPSGKMEAKWYSDGERLKIKVRKLKLPNGSTPNAFVDEQNIGTITLESGQGNINTEGASVLPPLEMGQTVEIRYQDEAWLRGKLYRD